MQAVLPSLCCLTVLPDCLDLAQSEILQHQTEDCSERGVECDQCGATYIFKDESAHRCVSSIVCSSLAFSGTRGVVCNQYSAKNILRQELFAFRHVYPVCCAISSGLR